MSAQTQLTITQVKNWLSSYRRKLRKKSNTTHDSELSQGSSRCAKDHLLTAGTLSSNTASCGRHSEEREPTDANCVTSSGGVDKIGAQHVSPAAGDSFDVPVIHIDVDANIPRSGDKQTVTHLAEGQHQNLGSKLDLIKTGDSPEAIDLSKTAAAASISFSGRKRVPSAKVRSNQSQLADTGKPHSLSPAVRGGPNKIRSSKTSEYETCSDYANPLSSDLSVFLST